VPVVVASKTRESIARSDELAIVSYGSGEIILRRQRGKQAEITSHYLDETVAQSQASVADGYLKVNVEARNATGKPLEWIEVRIS
jgi:hypothetical protein